MPILFSYGLQHVRLERSARILCAEIYTVGDLLQNHMPYPANLFILNRNIWLIV